MRTLYDFWEILKINKNNDKLLQWPKCSKFTYLVPPWYLCFFLGVQHFLTCFGSTVSIPLILAPAFCIGDDVDGNLVKSYLISTIFVGSGICTLLQTRVGKIIHFRLLSRFRKLLEIHMLNPQGPRRLYYL